jgi:diguanylate cyclase (GGDEF)-like protein
VKPVARLLLPVLVVALIAPAQAVESPAALVERSRSAMRVDPEASRRLAEEALARLVQQPDADAQIRAHLQLCDYYSERSREQAQQQIERARELLPQARRAALRAGLLLCEGELHQYAVDNVQAMALFQQAVSVAESQRDDELLAEALYQRGYLRGLLGELASGLADLRQSIAINERLKLPQQVQTATNSVAILYNRMGDYGHAREYFEASLRSQQAQGLTREIVVTQHNLGRVLENLKEWDAAQRAFETVLALSREIGYRRGEAYALRGLASVRNARDAPADALALLEHAARAQQQTPDERLRAQILLQRGIALRGLKRIDASAAELQRALKIFRQAESLAEIAASHGELARTLAAAGDWRGAYEQQMQFKKATDALLTRQLDQRFATLRVEFDTEAKVKENALLQRENAAAERALEQERRASRLQAVVLVLLLLMAALLGVLAWRQRRDSQAMRQLAMTDELTGLPNRRRVLAQLEALLAEPERSCALLIADLDNFKSINDTHGHPVGDEVLRAVANVLQEAARDPIVIGRLGGEEFVLLLPDADEDAAHALGQRLLAQVRNLDVSQWFTGRRLSVSIGLTVSVPGDTVGRMLRRADYALYAAKASGRDRLVARTVADEVQMAIELST